MRASSAVAVDDMGTKRVSGPWVSCSWEHFFPHSNLHTVSSWSNIQIAPDMQLLSLTFIIMNLFAVAHSIYSRTTDNTVIYAAKVGC